MLTLLAALALLTALLWVGFKITGALLMACLWLFVLLPVALLLFVLGLVCCCTILLIPLGVWLLKAGVSVLVPDF